METKVCKRCGAEKSKAEFHLTNSARGLLRGTCKVCDRDIAREYYHSHPEHAERVRKASASRYAAQRGQPKEPRAKKTIEEKRAAKAAYMRDYVAAHPEVREASRVRSKQWGANHPEQYQKRKEYILQWHKDHPMPGDRKRRNDIRSLYGVRAEDYQRMFDAQNGKCALCGTINGGKKKLAWKWGIGTLSIDHCHETGRVRGLLCHLCNTRLGAYERLLGAVGESKVKDYLNEPRATPA